MLSVISPPPPQQQQQQQKVKRKRNLPGNPDPDAEVIALSPKDLLTTNRFICEICNKGFQRDQNLQLHRRGHNLPWKLRQRSGEIRKRVYVCPEPSCVHHNPSRALGDLTGIKKHYCRKHGEKRWKCEKCAKKYAVQSDWKAHSKTCGTKEYKCDCGTLFSRKDSFITHRAFCDALAEESARLSTFSSSTSTTTNPNPNPDPNPTEYPSLNLQPQNPSPPLPHFFPYSSPPTHTTSWVPPNTHFFLQSTNTNTTPPTLPSHNMSATALLQKAAHIGATPISHSIQSQSVGHTYFKSSSSPSMTHSDITEFHPLSHMSNGTIPMCNNNNNNNNNHIATWQKKSEGGMTRDFLGLAQECGGGGGGSHGVRDMFSLTRTVDFPTYDRDHSLFLRSTAGFGFAQQGSGTWVDCVEAGSQLG